MTIKIIDSGKQDDGVTAIRIPVAGTMIEAYIGQRVLVIYSDVARMRREMLELVGAYSELSEGYDLSAKIISFPSGGYITFVHNEDHNRMRSIGFDVFAEVK